MSSIIAEESTEDSLLCKQAYQVIVHIMNTGSSVEESLDDSNIILGCCL